MKTPVIVIRGTDNIITITPISNSEDVIQSLLQDANKTYGISRVIEQDELPQMYPDFFDALNLKEGFEKETNIQDCFIYDIEKAKEILKELMRKARQPLLEALDTQFIIALEKGEVNKIKEITTKKQQLRDVTALELPNNFNEIQNFWPTILGSHPYKII